MDLECRCASVFGHHACLLAFLLWNFILTSYSLLARSLHLHFLAILVRISFFGISFARHYDFIRLVYVNGLYMPCDGVELVIDQ
ncbi:hypothetical protein BDN72DRAFT_79509 [Pluteus cervinus]|uniref:Uncharacterized protein n=1 Tax=Pluteus cervinus TaxID=181527 RepID=A0ACD3B8M8_9AGAR|nr:hypothetical protein BDN72DRAFT_79509 [Pluteus cervinus]